MGLTITEVVKKEKEQEKYIEPLPGEQVDNQEEQYLKDFGQEFDVDDYGAVMIDEATPIGKVEVEGEEKEEVVVSATAKEVKKDVVEPKEEGIVDEKTEVNLDDYILKATFTDLETKYNKLQGEFNDAKNKINEGLVGVTAEEGKILKQLKYDVENTGLGILVNDFYDGKIDPTKFMTRKTVKDFTPEGVEYNSDEAVQDPFSASWKAREAWERDKEENESKYKQIGLQASEKLKKQASAPTKEEKESYEKGLIDELVTKIPQSKDKIELFLKTIDNQKNLYLMLYPTFHNMLMNSKKGKGVQAGVESITAKTKVEKKTTSDQQMDDIFGD